MNREKISKIEAAERQLKTAIRLFFKKEDSVSIHTLATAVSEVLHDIGKKRGIRGMRNDSDIKKEYKKLYFDILKGPENFFKHGEKDPKVSIDFNPETTQPHMFDAVVMYIKLTGGIFSEGWCFLLWFLLKNPNISPEVSKTLSAPFRSIGIDPDKDFDCFRQALESGLVQEMRFMNSN
jgi:hypothetical protein